MSAVDEILSSIDPAQLAAALGTDEQTARAAAAAAIPTLINGLQANAGSPDGEAGLLAALGQHAGTGLYGDQVDLNAVDTADGQKIVAHALADDPNRLQAVSGLSGGLLAKLLPLLAPIVMSYLAKRLGMGGAAGQVSGGSASGGTGDLLGSILGGLLGGSSGGASAGGLGDILGQVLGGQQGGAAPAGTPADTTSGYGAAPDGGDSGSGGVFTAPGNSTGIQIPTDDSGEQGYDPQQPQQSGSGDILGGLLGQILGR